jgi:hypothetical protein
LVSIFFEFLCKSFASFPPKDRKLKEEKKIKKKKEKMEGEKKRKKREKKKKREKGAAAWEPLAAHARTPGRPTGPYAADAHVHMGFSHVGPALKGAQLGPCAASKKAHALDLPSSQTGRRNLRIRLQARARVVVPTKHCRNDSAVVLDWCPGATFTPLSF